MRSHPRGNVPRSGKILILHNAYRGLVASCQAATQNWQGMMALRFLMGAFEAGFGPGVPYLLSFFYRRHELGLRCGLFLSAAPLANTFAGALAYGITSGHATLANWRVLFLVEGIPVCAAAILAWFFVPDSPSTAKFLTEEEKEVARARGLQQAGDADREGKVQWRELAMTLLDAKAWLTAVGGPSRAKIKTSLISICCVFSSCTSAATSASHHSRSSYPPSLRKWATQKLTRRVSLHPHFSPLLLLPSSLRGWRIGSSSVD